MALRDDVTRICRRLAPRGWGRLLALHGLRLDTRTLKQPVRLEKELLRRLPRIDRSVKGFEDFSPAGIRAIEKGQPGRSLLYHALASPLVKRSPNDIAVMPARYAAFLAEWRGPVPEDAILREQAGDDDRSFLFPVHKLFDGRECLRGVDLRLTFKELHRNEKVQKVHTVLKVPVVAGFDIHKAPFVRQSDSVDDLVELERNVNIRHRVHNPVAGSPIEELSRIRNRQTFLDLIANGEYEAAHFIDDTCEGCITIDVRGLDLSDPDVNN